MSLKSITIQKMNLTNQEPRSERSSPCCTASEHRSQWDVVFWSLIHSREYTCSSQNFPSDKTAGVLSRTFKVNNMSNSLTYTVASSCVCTSTIGAYDYRRTARFRQGIGFSITQVLFCWSRASTLRSPQQSLVLQVWDLVAHASTYFPKVRRRLLIFLQF